MRPQELRLNSGLGNSGTAALLIEVAQSHPADCRRCRRQRPLLANAVAAQTDELEQALREEEIAERERDKLYWLPLRKELERLRHAE